MSTAISRAVHVHVLAKGRQQPPPQVQPQAWPLHFSGECTSPLNRARPLALCTTAKAKGRSKRSSISSLQAKANTGEGVEGSHSTGQR